MEREDELNELLSNIEKSTLTNLRSNIDELGEKLNLQQTEFEAVKQEVERFRTELKITVDKACDTLLDEVEQKEVEIRSEIESIIKDIEPKIKANEDFISACSARIRAGGLGLIGYNPGVPPSHDPLVSQLQMHKPEFVPGRDLVEMITKNVGNIKMIRSDSVDVKGKVIEESASVDLRGKSQETDYPHHQVADAARLEKEAPDTSITAEDKERKIGKSSEKLLNVNAQVMGSFQTKIRCRIIAVGGKAAAWIGDWYSNTIYLYSDGGKIMSSVDTTSGVWGLAVKRSGDVIVCSNDEKVRLVTGAGKVSTLTDTSPFIPRGVYLTTKEEIVVCMVGQGHKNHVAMYSADGKSKLHEITVKDDKGRQMLCDPVSIVMIGEDLSVLNCNKNVVTFDQSGKVRWAYDGLQAEREGRFCEDTFCNLLVSDWRWHCVHYVDREGVLIQLLLTREQHGIECPWGIGVDNETGDVWVGNDAGKVWVAKYFNT